MDKDIDWENEIGVVVALIAMEDGTGADYLDALSLAHLNTVRAAMRRATEDL